MAIFFSGDISKSARDSLLGASLIACDTETSGLDWRVEKLELCQMHSIEMGTVILQLDKDRPTNFIQVVEASEAKKIFHHAPFDLAFMRSSWGLTPKNVACTKIASKLLAAGSEKDHSLKALLDRELGVEIRKGAVRTSNWAATLSAEQIEYATDDVRYLIPLYERLLSELKQAGLEDAYQKCCDFLPARCELDQIIEGDIFAY